MCSHNLMLKFALHNASASQLYWRLAFWNSLKFRSLHALIYSIAHTYRPTLRLISMRTIQKSYSDAHVSTTHRTRTTISAPALTFMLEYPAKVLDGNIHAQSKQLFLRGRCLDAFRLMQLSGSARDFVLVLTAVSLENSYPAMGTTGCGNQWFCSQIITFVSPLLFRRPTIITFWSEQRGLKYLI